MSPDWSEIADTLATVANLLEQAPGLDPDGAVRLAIWGDANATYPGDTEPGAALFDEVESAIECKTGWQGNGIAHIPAAEAATAARDEAWRFRKLG